MPYWDYTVDSVEIASNFGKLSISEIFGHTSFIRAVAVDELGQTLYSGADDKKIKIWQAR